MTLEPILKNRLDELNAQKDSQLVSASLCAFMASTVWIVAVIGTAKEEIFDRNRCVPFLYLFLTSPNLPFFCMGNIMTFAGTDPRTANRIVEQDKENSEATAGVFERTRREGQVSRSVCRLCRRLHLD